MLKIGGVSVVTTPNAYNYRGGFSGNPFHIKEYTKTELETLFGSIIPHDKYNVFAYEDTFGTKVELLIKKALPQSLLSRIMMRVVVKPIKLLEKMGIIPAGYKGNLRKIKLKAL